MSIRRITLCILAIAIFCIPLTGAQDAPKPGPGHEKLGYWVGTWVNEGEIKENPMMPAGKFKGKDSCEWFEGKFAVVCRSEGTGPMGPSKGLGIMSYSSEMQVYTYYGTDSLGMTMTSVPKGTVDGKTWVYDDESKMGDATFKSRYTIVVTSEDSYTFRWEMEGPDGNWMTIMEGKGKRS